MEPDTPDREPHPVVQIGRMDMITGTIDAMGPHLDGLADLFQTLFADDYQLPDAQRMPNLEAMDLQHAMEQTRRGLRSMRRIARLHAHELTDVLNKTEPACEHLSPVPAAEGPHHG